MRTAITNTRRPGYYTVREAAWILAVEPSRIWRTIRLGTLRAGQRHGHLVVPASALTRLLGERTDDRKARATKPHVARSHATERRPRSGGARW